MKERVKKILQVFGFYHPLQSFYRSALSRIQNIKYRISYAKFKGSGFTCNVCGARYEKFVNDYPQPENAESITKHHVIAGYGKNIICPNCLSTARERLVLAMLDGTELHGKRVLHFSPEKHIYTYLQKQAEVTTADLTPGFYIAIDKDIKKEDATRLSYAGNYFDLVIGNHIMEHIPDDITAMREIFRVLKPGGTAILQIPYSEIISSTLESPSINDPALQSALYGQKDHVRIYALEDYIRRLRSVGFEVGCVAYKELTHLYKFASQQEECFLNIEKPMA